jgi:phosphopantothenoylcysteine decarboxylase/phosphopantothenate--cysteine ligase
LGGYEVLLCVTGGIACYKVAELTSRLVQASAGVTVAMSDAALQFMTPLTFQTLTAQPVYTSMWQSTREYRSGHISLTEAADLMVIAPATANILGKLANGIADELISTLALSANEACDILVAPAMNTRMWRAPAMRANMERLTAWGVHVIGPGEGFLACRTVGPGRMTEPDAILARITELLLRQPPKAGR